MSGQGIVILSAGQLPGHRHPASRVLGVVLALCVVAGGLVAGPADVAMATAGSLCSSTPFRSDPSHHIWFRIPAVVRTRAGTLLAFAERRDRELGDIGNFDVVTERSGDNGCHWSTYQVIGNDGLNRVSNPVPMVDASTGDVLLFSVVLARSKSGHGKGLYLQTSSDDGRTFSPLLERSIRPEGQYKNGLTGPGHGLQLSITHPGRLIVPMGYKLSSGLYGGYGLFSDDHGATWHTGYDQQDTTGQANLMEGTIAELPSGDLFISYRLKHDLAKAGTARQYAISADGGETLSRSFTAQALNIVSVQGSVLALKGVHSRQLLFSAPADPKSNLRRDMSIFVSTTSGRTWARSYQVELASTPGSYSDLTQIDENTIGVLYETGEKKWKERIAFESMAIPDLTAPALATSHLSYQRPRSIAQSQRARVRVKVTVEGTSHPPGRITLAYAGQGTSGSASKRFTYSTRGSRTITLPRLKRGRYRLVLIYFGYGRIRKLTQSAGILRVLSDKQAAAAAAPAEQPVTGVFPLSLVSLTAHL